MQDGTDLKLYMHPCTTDAFISPCWFMKVTHDLETYNMEMQEDLDDQVVTLNGSMKLPLLVNSCDLKAGTSLVLYRDEPVKAPAQIEALVDVKRRKTKKGQKCFYIFDAKIMKIWVDTIVGSGFQ
jgi:hypothetical protein